MFVIYTSIFFYKLQPSDLNLPAKDKVSVAWQIVFTFIPVLNLWAFYRIRKLRKYLLYIMIPSLILGGGYAFLLISTSLGDPSFAERASDPWFMYKDPFALVVNIAGWSLTGLTIYLVIIWSREHNNRLDAQTVSG